MKPSADAKRSGARSRLAVCCLLVVGTALLAMNVSPAAANTTPRRSSPPTTKLQVINLVPDSAVHGLTFYVDGFVFSGPFGFAGSTAFGTLRAGQHRIQVGVPHGRILVSMRVNLLNNQIYTLAAEGRQGGHVTALLLTDRLQSPVTGKAEVRFANAIPNVAAVAASLEGRGPRFSVTAFAGVSGYQSVTAGAYSLHVQSTTGKLLLVLSKISIQTGKTYTVYAIGPNSSRGVPGPRALVLSP